MEEPSVRSKLRKPSLPTSFSRYNNHGMIKSLYKNQIAVHGRALRRSDKQDEHRDSLAENKIINAPKERNQKLMSTVDVSSIAVSGKNNKSYNRYSKMTLKRLSH